MTYPSVDASSLPPPRQAVLDARPELLRAVGGRLSTAPLDRSSYARDLWPLGLLWALQGRLPPPPDAVVWPGTEAELVALVQLARARRLALIPFGAGSGVCGGTWAVGGGLTVDLKRFDAIAEVDVERRSVDVGAGVMGETLERHLNARGWTLGHFPSSMAMSTVGGWLAARSAGQFSSKYGKIEDIVLSVRAVLGTGEVLETPERPFSGADLTPLLVGSEGTLAFFTRARLRVFPLPGGRAFHGFDFASLEVGLEAMRLVFREGLRPAVVRLYDPFDTLLAGSGKVKQPRVPVPPSRRGVLGQWLPRALREVTRQSLGRPGLLSQLQRVFARSRLILMFEGDGKRAAADDRAAAAVCRALQGVDRGDAPGRAWLQARYDVAFRLSPLIESGAFADTMEVAAPWERVQQVYEAVRQAASAHALALCHFSHGYAEGCSLYFTFVGAAEDEAATAARYQELWRVALGAAVAAGGNVSHHHGVGLLKAQALQDSLGEGRHLLAQLKGLFDPDGVMNPGKLGLTTLEVPDGELRASGGHFEPVLRVASAEALRAGLHVLADAGGRLHVDAVLDRRGLNSLGAPSDRSMTVFAGAGATLRDIDAHARRAGLTLGPLTPAAMALQLGDFLEGSYAGLRAVAPGRLEPLCTRIEALSASGRRLETSLAPRSAAGPDLSALVLGAHGRLALLTAATLRCAPLPERELRQTFTFATGAACVTALTRAIAEGLVVWAAHLETREGAVLLDVSWQGSRAATERDRELVTRLFAASGGRSVDEAVAPASGEEREVTWRSVQRALDRGASLSLFRCALGSLVATGDVPGVSLSKASAWSSRAERLLALDPRRVLGGTV
jgi:alkyldihydroxyacetonephosphate synthase